MKNKIVFIYSENNTEMRKDIGYLRLLIAVLGSTCHIVCVQKGKHTYKIKEGERNSERPSSYSAL
jgi:hypothetical protein